MKHIFLTVSLALIMGVQGIYAQRIGINGDGSDPDPSAILDIKSGHAGLLIPRVELISAGDSETIENPANGLLVYVVAGAGLSPEGFYFNSGTPKSPVWIRLYTDTANEKVWRTLGNSGTLSGTHFLGTTDNQPLDFKTNNVLQFRMTTNGQLEFFEHRTFCVYR